MVLVCVYRCFVTSIFFDCIILRDYYVLLVFFFFFKQKTAYEMRISDWSSDVCSSDLRGLSLGFSLSRAARSGACLSNGVQTGPPIGEIGRASCRERVCQYV